MERLSSPLSRMQAHYDVIVIGSGYGGAIAASRMARAGQQICLLERGCEIHPGEYPDSELEAIQAMQTHLSNGKLIGSPTALYDFYYNDDISVFMGCGLGGTSLVNANVAITADTRVFDDPCWPADLMSDKDTHLKTGYDRALAMLNPQTIPTQKSNLSKSRALAQSAQYLDKPYTLLPLTVTFEDSINAAGIKQSACTYCGDCVSGCNVGAKNTTLMNYLPDAHYFGAHIFTQCSVSYLTQDQDNTWKVHYQHLDVSRESFDAPLLSVTANMVILAAGTLGSTGILLRSKAQGLTLSEQLGHRFSGNGDVLGFGYNCDVPIHGIGYGNVAQHDKPQVGPCITGAIDNRNTKNLDKGIIIEEGSIPGAIASLLPTMLINAAKILGKDTDQGLSDMIQEKQREITSLVNGPYSGSIDHTQTYLVMGHDASGGRMTLNSADQVVIHWQDIGEAPLFTHINDLLTQATEAIGGTYVPNPTWQTWMDHQLVTVHPLGGCVMADNAETGVVNHKGQVYNQTQGQSYYTNLYVTDGAIIPRSLGANPLLTISALAERACYLIAQDRGWVIDYTTTVPVQTQSSTRPVGIRFTETMCGFYGQGHHIDFQQAYEQGKSQRDILQFTLTIMCEDLEQFIHQENHPAQISGTLQTPISPTPCGVNQGTLALLIDHPDHIGLKIMRYHLPFINETGEHYLLIGEKHIKQNSGVDLWSDTTTLYCTVYAGSNTDAPVLGKGIMNIELKDFAIQLATITAIGATHEHERLHAISRFGEFFAGELYEIYGGVFRKRQTQFLSDAPLRKKRQLRVPLPKTYPMLTEDNIEIRLTRYQGGKKGPVLLTHGLGVSSSIFRIDTIETNLLEYLVAHGYDCWLLDYRASVDLAASEQLFTADVIAKYDYPLAIKTIQYHTGCESVQAVAHCFGSTTLNMALLAGLSGVRSLVCSQIATDIISPPLTQLKTGLYMPELLDTLGIDSLTTDTNSDAPWWERALDKVSQFYPGNLQDINPVSRRITFMYGPLYEMNQLNQATYQALHEMFGVANIDCFKHLASMVRHKKLVNAQGEDTYLPHINRLALPTLYLHGEKNQCFLPQSTIKTMERLSDENGKAFYDRIVIPEYGHIDCIFGKNAVHDVYPYILTHLEQHQITDLYD